jgi:hypothetical protein
MKKHPFFPFSFLCVFFFSFSMLNCKGGDETASEVITTVELHLTGNNLDKKFYWRDKDGDGGNNPIIDTLLLPVNMTGMKCSILLYDESKNPVDNITEELKAEADDHLFVYQPANAGLKITYNDRDNNGKNLGLQTLWATETASVGTLNITLYHEPINKDNLNAPGGDVDVSVVFPVRLR